MSAMPSAPFIMTIGEAVRALDEIAIGVGRQQRHVEHVRIGQIDAENVARLRLDHRPGRHAADLDVVGGAEMAIGPEIAIGDQLAGRHRMAVGIELVGAQERLMRGMGGIGLVLVDERSRGVLVLVDVIGGARDAVGPDPAALVARVSTMKLVGLPGT